MATCLQSLTFIFIGLIALTALTIYCRIMFCLQFGRCSEKSSLVNSFWHYKHWIPAAWCRIYLYFLYVFSVPSKACCFCCMVQICEVRFWFMLFSSMFFLLYLSTFCLDSSTPRGELLLLRVYWNVCIIMLSCCSIMTILVG